MPKRMIPKERVLTAFAMEKPDRVPMNYSANTEIDHKLKRHFALSVDDTEGLLCKLGVDFRSIGAPYVGPELHESTEEIKRDYWGICRRWVEHESGGYWDYCEWPLKNASLDEVESWPMPNADDFDYESVTQRCKELERYCIIAGSPGIGDIINSTGMLRTMEQTLVDLMLDDPVCLRLIDRKLAIMVETIGRTLEAAGGKIDILHIGEDLGTQIGPMIGLELFKKHIRPRLQKFVDLAKHWNIPVMIHSCGSSSWAFEDFIDMGISIVDTLQPEAKDMSPAYLKEKFGDKLCFHGMISTAGPLAYGSADEITANVKETLETMMPGGGYAMAPTHSIQSNSPVENVIAMYEAGLKYGVYPNTVRHSDC